MRVTATDADDQEKNMKKSMVSLAGAVLASASAGANDQWAEERLKAKTGRYSPAEELRRAEMRTANHTQGQCQAACCREHSSSRHQTSATATGPTGEFLKAKVGREPRQAVSHEHRRQASTKVQPSASDTWARAKFGRDLNARTYVQTAPESVRGVE